MTLTPFRSRSGEIPPGCVDGFCTACQREVIADETDPRCPNCFSDLHPLSLPSVPRNGAQAGQPDAKPANPTKETANAERTAQKPVTLRPSRAAVAWDRATDALLAAAEQDERDADSAYQIAKARYEAARQDAHRIRQLRGLVRVDAEPPALPAPREKPTAPKGRRTHHIGRHAASGPCKGCPPPPEDTTDGN